MKDVVVELNRLVVTVIPDPEGPLKEGELVEPGAGNPNLW